MNPSSFWTNLLSVNPIFFTSSPAMSRFNVPPFSQPFQQQHEPEPPQPVSSPTTHSDFTIEELPDDYQSDSLEILHPYELEEHQSETSPNHNHSSHETSDTDSSSSDFSTDAEISNPMRRLRCSTSARRQRHDREPSSPISTTSSRKRTFSQSTVADTDTEYESTATSDSPSRNKRLRRQRRRGLDVGFQSHAGGSPTTSSLMPFDKDVDSALEDYYADQDHMDID